MTEADAPPHYAVQAGVPQATIEFGPTPVDQQVHADLLERASQGELFPNNFDPSNNAVLTGGQIDQGAVSTFVNHEAQADVSVLTIVLY